MRAFINSSSGSRGVIRPVGLHGFGDVGNLGVVTAFVCDSFDQAIETLGRAVSRGEAEKLTGPEFTEAKAVYETETSWNLFGRTFVSWGRNCEDQTSRIGTLILALNSRLKNPVQIPPSILVKVKNVTESAQPTEPVPLWVKATVIGGIAVVGLIAVGVITGQVAPILKRL